MSAPRFTYAPGTGRAGGVPESTTSYDSRSEEGRVEKAREAREAFNSSRDATRDTSYSRGGGDDDYVPRTEHRFVPRGGRDTASEGDSMGEPHGSYDFRYPAYPQKVEWSCDEAGGMQKLSFLFLVLAFLGHSIAVCTPYWAVAWMGDQMSVYEGVWLSCYREEGVGRWICSNYDTIRNLFEQPPWYEASQICAVLTVILLIPALVGATLYSYVVSLSGRSRASWVLICFLTATLICGFISFVAFGAGYDLDQKFPPGDARLHASFGLQIVSFLFCCVSLGTHIKDSKETLKTWNNNEDDHHRRPVRPAAVRTVASAPRATRGPYVTSAGTGSAPEKKTSSVPKLPSFSMPKFPSSLSRFRSSKDEGGSRASPAAPPPPPASGGRGGGGGGAYKSYAPSSGGGSVSGYDSQV